MGELMPETELASGRDRKLGDPGLEEDHERLRDLASRADADHLRILSRPGERRLAQYLRCSTDGGRGGRMFGQVHSRSLRRDAVVLTSCFDG